MPMITIIRIMSTTARAAPASKEKCECINLNFVNPGEGRGGERGEEEEDEDEGVVLAYIYDRLNSGYSYDCYIAIYITEMEKGRGGVGEGRV